MTITEKPVHLFSLVATVFASVLTLATGSASAQSFQTDNPPPQHPSNRVQIELLSEKSAVQPGETVTVALRQTIIPGWHTYWINPGDSGEPTHIDWQLEPGASAGPIQWPLPHAIPVGPLMNYGYSDEVLLLTDLIVPKDALGPNFEIAADVRWLVCEEICVPESASSKLSLPLTDGTISLRPSPHAKTIADARKALPQPTPWPAQFDLGGGDSEQIAIKISNVADKLPKDGSIHFFPLKWGKIGHAAPQQVSFQDGDLVLQTLRGDGVSEEPPASLEGVLTVEQTGADGVPTRRGYSISAARASLAIAPLEPASAALGEDVASSGLSLLLALGFAFLGGIILNLMPCVFPVLALKAVSLAKNAGDAHMRRIKGFTYLGGVLFSFAIIALALIGLRMGGAVIGWGMQFQSPGFVLAMMALFLALGLNLSGVFSMGNSITGLGDSLTRRSGLSGDFFTGVLATVVATPCTAPFMGAAMGYAFSQPSLVIFAVLLALGAGFALPIVLLSLSPGFARMLPRPGAWMETFKQVMAFPLYATVAWLLWVLSVQRGSDGVLLGAVTLVCVGFAAWLLGRSGMNVNRLRDGVAALIVILAIGLSTWSLNGVAPAQQQGVTGTRAEGSPASEAFTQSRLDEVLAQNKPVFVNLTAAWCITCKVNERVALNSESFGDALEDGGITYLVGDWTNGNPEITALLSKHGRVGVPLYLLYTGRPGEAPIILPQLLTESIILEHFSMLPSPSPQTAQGDL